MRTARSHKYFIGSHGRCASPVWCKLQTGYEGLTYCRDNNGEYSDYCKHFIKPDFIGTIIWTIEDRETWKELKQDIKNKYRATFVLPIKQEDRKLIVFEINDSDNTRDVEGVIFTTDTAIASRYGIYMRYYTFRFLYDTLKKEIETMEEA